MPGEACKLVKGLVTVYELVVAEEPGYELLSIERFSEKRSERPDAAVRDGVIERVERFVTNTRPASEGSYHDAIAAWRLYEANCLPSPVSERLCRRIWDLLVSRLRRALIIWAGARGIGVSTVTSILRDLAKLHLGEIELQEYIRRHREHVVGAFAALHVSRPSEYPPFNNEVCGLVCRAMGGKHCSCGRMGYRELHKLYTDYIERLVKPLSEQCSRELSDLEKVTGKSRVKLIDEALWLVSVAEKKALQSEEFSKAFKEVMEDLGYPLDPRDALRRMEETLKLLLTGRSL